MARPSAIGPRIRRRRLDLGVKQADLARACGISASYLNLIEHDRRSIGGKLLARLADELDISPERLRSGADRDVVAALRTAAADMPETGAEAERAEDVSAEFPGWSRLVAAQAQRIASLERTVEAMGDRMTHDPQLAAALHNILSTVTAIRSTSAILAGDDPVDAGWQDRFHRNLMEESQRLAEATEALVGEFEADPVSETLGTPLEEAEAWLDRHADLSLIERGEEGEHQLLDMVDEALGAEAARMLARREIVRMAADARALPEVDLRGAIGGRLPDPYALADRFGVPLATVLRRLASLGDVGAGLAVCDASGTLTRRKQIAGFSMPRFGAACPVWPLYTALAQPGRPLAIDLLPAASSGDRFAAWAIAETGYPGGLGGVAVTEATMLVMPVAGTHRSGPALTVGASCRVCPAESCAARRELSILGAGL